MRARSKLLVTALTAVAAMAMAPSALGATQVGNQCVGNTSTETFTVFGTANGAGNPLPAAIPGNGVVTKWTFSVVPIPPGVLSQAVKILRPVAPGQFQVVGESALTPVNGGINTFSTRIPVHAGDLIGSAGSAGGEFFSIFCETGNPGDRIGAVPGNPPVGSTAASIGEEAGLQVPITVSVEPDADNDGFGDETQDACPQSATTQVACPVVSLNVSTTKAKKLVNVLVTSTIPANVTVNGKVNLGGGKKVKLKGGTKGTAPGSFTKFKLKFPAKLLDRLEELSPKQSLTLKITSTAPNVASAPTKKTVKVKLKGRG